MPKTVLFVFLSLSVACATTTWTKPGATGEELADDRLKCGVYARMTCGQSDGSPGSNMGTTICINKQRWNCMTERGWTEK